MAIKKVKVIDYSYDTDGKPTKPYRTSVSVYHNDSYFLNGLLKESYVMKGSDESKLFSKTINTYEIKKLSSDNQTIEMPQVTLLNTFDVGGSEGRRSAVVLLTETVNELYEGNSSPKLTSEVNMMYDAKGRVSIYNNRGNTAITTDDYTSGITYHDDNTALNAKNIISVPRRIKVFSGIITSETTINSSTASLRERTTTTDDNGNITSIAAKISGTTAPVNAVTTMTYDNYGNLKSIVYPANDATPTTPKKYTYEYDPIYNKYVTSITDGFGYSSSATYDSRFDKVLETKDLSDNIMTYTNDSFGRLETVTAPKERSLSPAVPTLKFQYFTKPGDFPNEYGITAANFAPVALTQHFDPANPANPIETYTFIDGLARPIQVKKDIAINTGSPTAPNYKEALSVSGKASYDRYGRAEIQYFPTFEVKPENGSPAKNFVLNETEPPIKSSTITLYDELDRPIQVQDPDGNNTTTDYSIEGIGNTVGATFIKTKSTAKQNGANNVVTETYKDVFGRVAYTNNLTSTTEGLLTQFTYNAIGELQSYKDAQGISTTYTYDNLGRKLSVTHPDNGKTSFQYDKASNLTKMQTANLFADTTIPVAANRFVNYTYDRNNRLTKIVFPVATGAPSPNLSDVTYTYGLPADLPNKRGKLIKQTDATGEQTFDYGNMGEMVSNERKIVATNTPTRTFKTYFEYDSWNRLKTMTYPDGEVISYTYDFGGNLTKMTGTLNGAPYNYVAQIDYDYFEQKTYMKYGNGSETIYSYSPNLRQLNNLKVVSNTQSLFDNTYSYDQVGNVTGIANTAGITTNNMGGVYSHVYEYDKLNRLSKANGSFTGSPTQTANNNDSQSNYTLEMAYNNTHGIASKKQTHFKNGITTPFAANTYENAYNYVANTHRLLSIVNPNITENYTYDTNGNLTKIANPSGAVTSTYSWDESNRLRLIKKGGNMQQYTYDASGERVLKSNVNFTETNVNGTIVNTNLTVLAPTTYPSAFMVVDPQGNCSNHYYLGSQRIVSRISDKPASFYVTGSVLRQSADKKQDKRSDKDLQLQQKNYLQTLVDKANLGKVTYAEYKPYTYEEIEKALKEEEENDDEPSMARMANTSTPPAAAPIYFYHPDHLGTSTFLTDANGNAYQFFLNLPFGETMAEQLPSSSYTSPYKFNGKELDAETGLYYYGARYYDPKSSIWLSVDPLVEKFPNISPYAYCENNPTNMVDPTGMSSKSANSPIYDSESGKYLGVDNQGFLRGEVLFMDADKYKELSKNGKMDHNVAVKNSISIADLPDTEQGFKLFSKAADHISKSLNKLFYNRDAKDNLFGGNVQTYSDELRLMTSHGEDIGSDIGRSKNIVFGANGDTSQNVERITMGFDHRRQYLNTAPNIFSVFEHEFVAHGLMGLRQRVGSYDIHGEVYKFQVSTFNFRHYVTGDYKKLTLRRNEGYNRK
jgi:RHS repeat-associated protein